MKQRRPVALALLEVLVALGALGLVDVVFSSVAISSLRHTNSSEQRT